MNEDEQGHEREGNDGYLPIASAAELTAASKQSGTVAIEGPLGERIDVQLGAIEGDENDRKALAKSIVGWSDLTVDGEPYPYSPENALALVNRFSWVRTGLMAEKNKGK